MKKLSLHHFLIAVFLTSFSIAALAMQGFIDCPVVIQDKIAIKSIEKTNTSSPPCKGAFLRSFPEIGVDVRFENKDSCSIVEFFALTDNARLGGLEFDSLIMEVGIINETVFEDINSPKFNERIYLLIEPN